MNYISNIFEYFNNFWKQTKSINSINTIESTIEINNDLIIEPKKIYYIFINTENIYNASKLMLNNLYKNYNNKYIKIYLLKSHKLDPLFYNSVKINELNVELIKTKLLSKHRHLHTMIDAIDSFIEFNNIKNYQIYY
jgi:hypothetical protein